MVYKLNDISSLDRHLENIVLNCNHQRKYYMHKYNIVFNKEYIKYSKRYLKDHNIIMIRLFKKYLIYRLK